MTNKIQLNLSHWESNNSELVFALESANIKQNRYDIIFHIDGSLENLKLLYILKEHYNVKPLGITVNSLLLEDYQKSNIRKALEFFDIDHILFTPRNKIQKILRKKAPQNYPNLIQSAINVFSTKMAAAYQINCQINYSLTNTPLGTNVKQLDRKFIENNLVFNNKLEIEKLALTTFDLYSYFYDYDRYPLLKDQNLLDFSEMLNDGGLSELENYLSGHFKSKNDNVVVDSDKIWLGFPEDWTNDNTYVRKAKKTKYEVLSDSVNPRQPLYYNKLLYCTRCCMPETAEELEFDDLGICQPCRSSEQKMHIDWNERLNKLKEILSTYESKRKDFYDCIIPISGGKDSTFQLYVLTKILKKNIIAITFSPNWFSPTGRYNLLNSINKFDVDHVMFLPRRKIVNRLAKKSLPMIGDACWHCHAGVGAFPLSMATKLNVQLLIWGESVAENDGRATYDKPIIFDRDYFTKISARYYAEEMVDEKDGISLHDVAPYILPTEKEINTKSIRGIHLGDYMFWDDERQMEFVRDNYSWREDNVEGTYKGYKSVECLMAGIHDYTKFIKRGFGRGTDHASMDVRVGLLTRAEGFELAKNEDSKRPNATDYYLKITNYSEKEFESILKNKREGKAKLLP